MMCNFKNDARSDDRSEEQFISVLHFRAFQLIVLVLRDTTLLFWFTLIAQQCLFRHSTQLF